MSNPEAGGTFHGPFPPSNKMAGEEESQKPRGDPGEGLQGTSKPGASAGHNSSSVRSSIRSFTQQT